MSDLRAGHDYHLAEVRRTNSGTWQSFCPACGWLGATRDTKGAAEDDAAAHDVTENPA